MIKTMNQSTVQEILTLLSTNPPLTIAEISRQLNLTKADIRYHVSRLAAEGKIKTAPIPENKNVAKPGRPAKSFTVSDQVYPDNINELIQTWFFLSELKPETLQDAARIMANNFSMNNIQSTSVFQTMNHIITELNERHYNARWEIKPNGPVIYFHNCPYKSLVSQNPQLCKFDQYLLSELTNSTILPQYTIAQDHTPRCMFSLTIEKSDGVFKNLYN